ncbi:MAG: histidine kinase [Bacteroidota bacterium]
MNDKYTILYVDDEPGNLLAFRSIFRRKYRVLTCESGEEALGILEKEAIQLLISDQRMPGMQGTKLLEIARQKYPDLVRILLTGYTDMYAIIEAINKSKIYHYITKPWRVEELEIIIRQALEVYELRTAKRQLTNERDQLILRAAQQEKEQVKAKFEILRNQINPHFLFNSLNILTSLIPIDPEKATIFATRFSRVYRRLLEFKDIPLVSLAEELDFTEDFLFLQQIRFDSTLSVKQELHTAAKTRKLPPFSIQLLVENALKHNIVSEAQPLHIDIVAHAEELSVTNNLQPRPHKADSTKIGWKNLCERYALLTDKTPYVEANEQQYKAVIPLLA